MIRSMPANASPMLVDSVLEIARFASTSRTSTVTRSGSRRHVRRRIFVDPAQLLAAGVSDSSTERDRLEQVAPGLAEDRLEHLVLRREVVVEQAVRDAGLLGDVADARTCGSPCGRTPERRRRGSAAASPPGRLNGQSTSLECSDRVGGGAARATAGRRPFPATCRGRIATRELLRLGARVVRVEPPEGDPLREVGARLGRGAERGQGVRRLGPQGDPEVGPALVAGPTSSSTASGRASPRGSASSGPSGRSGARSPASGGAPRAARRARPQLSGLGRPARRHGAHAAAGPGRRPRRRLAHRRRARSSPRCSSVSAPGRAPSRRLDDARLAPARRRTGSAATRSRAC